MGQSEKGEMMSIHFEVRTHGLGNDNQLVFLGVYPRIIVCEHVVVVQLGEHCNLLHQRVYVCGRLKANLIPGYFETSVSVYATIHDFVSTTAEFVFVLCSVSLLDALQYSYPHVTFGRISFHNIFVKRTHCVLSSRYMEKR